MHWSTKRYLIFTGVMVAIGALVIVLIAATFKWDDSSSSIPVTNAGQTVDLAGHWAGQDDLFKMDAVVSDEKIEIKFTTTGGAEPQLQSTYWAGSFKSIDIVDGTINSYRGDGWMLADGASKKFTYHDGTLVFQYYNKSNLKTAILRHV